MNSFNKCEPIVQHYRRMQADAEAVGRPITAVSQRGWLGGKLYQWTVPGMMRSSFQVTCYCGPLTLGAGFFMVQPSPVSKASKMHLFQAIQSVDGNESTGILGDIFGKKHPFSLPPPPRLGVFGVD